MARIGHRKGSDAIMAGTVIGLSIALLSTGINALGARSPFALPGLVSSHATVSDIDTGPIAAAWASSADPDIDLGIASRDDAHTFSEWATRPHRHDPLSMDDDTRWIGSVREPYP